MRTNHQLSMLSAKAAKQLSLFTRSQAQSSGLSNKQLRGLVGRGLVEAWAPDVFRFASTPMTWHQTVLAACLAGGPECVASHRTAAALHKLDGFKPGGPVDVLLPANRRLSRADVVVHRTRDLPPEDRTRVGSIPVTTVARTLIDLGAVVSAEMVEEAFDGAERDRRVQRSDVARRYTALRAPGRNGIAAMTHVLPERVPLQRVPWSVLERRFRRISNRAGVAPPLARFRVQLLDGSIVELDFAFVDLLLAIELDGHGAHATRRARRADNRRANALADLGWTLRRFTYEEVMYEPAAVVSAVRSAVAARSIA
jgi:predicted transcriptional regulator of viral defense system